MSEIPQFARDSFLGGGSTKLPERERNRRKEVLLSPLPSLFFSPPLPLSLFASNIKREIYARTNAELRKTLFFTRGKRVSRSSRPEIPLVAGTRNFRIDKSAINGISRKATGATAVGNSAACRTGDFGLVRVAEFYFCKYKYLLRRFIELLLEKRSKTE